MERLGLPFFCFHDRDVAPEGDRPRQSNAMLDQVLERIEGHMQRTEIRLLWGTAICSVTPATWRARPPIRTRRCSPSPPRR